MYHYHLMTSRPTSVGIWVVSDANNAIIDRVVVKDCWVIDQNFPGDWTDPKFWFGDPMDPLTKQPTEALIHAKLSHDESIVQMRSWHMHAHKLMYRVGPRNGFPQSFSYNGPLWLTVCSYALNGALLVMRQTW